MNQIRNILVAAGHFPQDDPVLARAAEIAREHQARLTLAHVVDSLAGIDFTDVDLIGLQHQLQLVARQNVDAGLAKQNVGASEIDIRIEAGSPALRLIELIDEMPADLVVMRANQRESILEKIIGSTTDRVIRASRAPVLVVKRPVRQAYRRVVVATDASDESAAAVAFAAALFPLAGLHLVHAVQIPPQFESVMLRAGSGQANITAYRDALVSKAKTYMRDMSETLANRPIQGTTRVVVGDPAKALAQATWSRKVDLIVLGSGNAGLIRRALLGSVTRQMLQAAACDVLVVRPVAREASA
jgi:nucleotide-binding universal stress UspA family protein